MGDKSLSVLSPEGSRRTLVSASRGFSRPGGAEIRSLNDLLRAIQPLNIRLYDGASLRNPQKAGEGASYTVFQYTDIGTGKAVAIKQIKLPDDTNNHQALQNRVDCVLKDIEVMNHPPLAQHENILTLLGYGWGLQKGDVIPFIVTDYAALGTLRDYLKDNTVTLQSKLALCSQVACGLKRLHWTSVAHGDLKLENVLVFNNSTVQGTGTYETNVMAKLSDFGHACLFSDEQGHGVIQTYRGTLWYLAPELRDGSSLQTVEFLRCDIWALGLLCLEIVWDGIPYFHLPAVRSRWKGSQPVEEATQSSEGRGQIFDLCPDLAEAAERSVDGLPYRHEFRTSQETMIKGIFRRTLQVDPYKRPHDLSELPFVFGGGLHLGWNNWDSADTSQSISRDLLKEGWTYENFTPRVASQIPFRVKLQMFLDAKRTALSKEDDSTRASLQVGLAFLNGFGIKRDLLMAKNKVENSASSACLPAKILLLILNDRYVDLDKLRLQVRTAKVPRSLFAKFGFWASREHLSSSSYQLLSQSGRSKLEKYSPHIDSSLLTQEVVVSGINRSPLYRQQALLLACQLGDLDALISLASQTVEPLSGRGPGPTPLHYLFMFDRDNETLDRALNTLLPTDIESRGTMLESYCYEPQRLDRQLPFSLTGTPLNFATVAGSLGAVEALLNVGANPISQSLGPTTSVSLIPRNPLQNAVSHHQSDIFAAIWKSCLLQPGWHDRFVAESFHRRESLFSQLCERSPLERLIMQSGGDMMSTLVNAIWELLRVNADSSREEGLERRFAKQVATGLEHILTVDGLEVAQDLFTRTAEISGISLLPSLDDGERESLMEALLQIACQGSVMTERATAYIKFGHLLFKDASPSIDFLALISSSRYHNDSFFSMLLRDGRDFDKIDNDGRGVLWHFVDSGFSRMIPLAKVLERDPKADVADNFGETPLHCAVRRQSVDDAAILIAAGADINRKLPDGTTALHVAVQNLDIPLVQCLLDRHASVNAADGRAQSALHTLFLQAPVKEPSLVFAVANLLLSRDASTCQTDNSGWTPVHALALWDDEVISMPDFRRLVSRINLSVRGEDGTTLLHAAARRYKIGLVSELMSLGVGVDRRDNYGATPLHALVSRFVNGKASPKTASLDRVIPTARALLEARPNIVLADNRDMIALDQIVLACDHAAVNIGIRINLLCLILDHSCTGLLDKAWSHAVSNKRWLAAREILSRETVNLNLLRWPVGVSFLLFGIDRADLVILRLFLGPGFSSWSPNQRRINRGIKERFKYPSERSQNWSPQEHVAWERGVSADTVHCNRGRMNIPYDILDFVLKYQDFYKMGPLGWARDKTTPRSWLIVDELLLACQTSGRD